MTIDFLWRRFVDPPDDARPRVWWHWMDGNIDPAGIRRDLAWLHSVGVRGVQVFDGGMGVPCVVGEPVRPGSEIWDDAVATARTVAAELGMELAVATSPGWSAAGGPWVQPRDAMKKVVWSKATVTGGSPVKTELPPLPDETGVYQDSPRPGSTDATPRYAADWVVLAFPADVGHEVLQPGDVTASAFVDDWMALTDGSFRASVQLPRDPDGWSTAWIEQSFPEPVSVSSVVVGLPGPRGFGAAPAARAILQCSDGDGVYRDVVELAVTSAPARTASFAPVKARRFRLVLSGESAAAALPPLDDGVRLPPVLRTSSTFAVTEFALRSTGRVHAAEAKAGFAVVPDYDAIDTVPALDGIVDASQVIELTPLLSDGVLRWTPPAGRWTVLRLGASLTGQTNGPAPIDSTGLEVDKLDGSRVAAYLDTYLERHWAFSDAGMPRITALLSDSIEAGPQNWTETILDSFESLRGYDPRRWLPALAGYLVGDPESSDRFLYDYRRTIAELLAEQYYGTLAVGARERGMISYAEALEDGRPQLGDDLEMRSHADVPMGAMWTFDPAAGPRPTYVADLKGASSVAHVYGRSWTGAEAFSSFDRPWSTSPRSLKHVADVQSALGVTRFCIHTSPHQPLSTPPPGIALAPFLGQAFTVHETWADMAGPWIDYLARCSAVLSAGSPALDVAVFIGEEAPVTALFGESFDDSVPQDYDYDYIGFDALATVLRVDADGSLLSDGAAYRLLYLGGSSSRMTVAALRHVERLLDAGATVVGARPIGSASLNDDRREFAEVSDRIWGARTAGTVVETSDLASAVTTLGLRPALEIDGPPLRRIARIVDGRRVTFLANPSEAAVTVGLHLADGPPLEAWDPVSLRAWAVPTDRHGARREARASLPAFGSLFLVETDHPSGEPFTVGAVTELTDEWRLHLPRRDAIVMRDGPRLWTEEADARGFAGTGRYVTNVTVAAGWTAGRIALDLGDVRDIARVHVNGTDCGVAWTPPFRVDVTDALRPGSNRLEVDVATPWRNRLIAEAGAPTDEIFSPMTTVYEPSAEFLPAGLAGPVRLIAESSG